ncbi:MAG: substrate-binding domain-containing protein, partial [Prevotellaceae bacterium]|nr:substrate-binding domain-containing protein [Prevotellaceae bacterium]
MKHTHLILLLSILLFFSCQSEEKQYIIGVSQCSDDEWRHKMNMEMQHEAMFHDGITLDIKTVGDDTERQIADIEGFIRQKVDLIIVAPNQARPVTPVVEKAFKAGIPVILVD